MAFRARYGGKCEACLDTFEAGQLIESCAGVHGAYVHGDEAECAAGAERASIAATRAGCRHMPRAMVAELADGACSMIARREEEGNAAEVERVGRLLAVYEEELGR